MTRTFRPVAALCSLLVVLLLACRPRLTEERVVDDLGEDELVLTIFTFDEPFLVQRECRTDVTSFDEDLAAAQAAGWIEQVCKGDFTVMKLTAAGRRASARWENGGAPRSGNEAHRWDVIVARYKRTGPPVIRPGATSTERLVTIPGHWIPNEDGKRLYATGWKTITAVNRVEKFTYYPEGSLWGGVWARRLLGR
jgi:hypothetical protein